jgi:hypothetical protein
MGTYLATGIVQEIVIDKKHVRYSDITIEKITQRLENKINLSYYDYIEDDFCHCWKIKPEALEENLAEFLDTQFQMYTSKKDKYMDEVIKKITKAKTGDEVTKLASGDGLINFQLVEQIIEYISIKRDNGFDENIMIFYSLIAYFMDGKIITEGLGNILKYFEANIRLQRDKYPIVNCVRVMVTS